MADIETRTVQTIDLSLGPGRSTLRLVLSRDMEGEPTELLIAVGFGTGDTFNRPSWGDMPIRLPASVLSELQEALVKLGAEE